ncbi:MAG: hypothetical protein ACYSW7_10430, partial [Planctomycetota bacterium]
MPGRRLFILIIYSIAVLLPAAAFPAVSDVEGGADEKEPRFRYPVNFRPAGKAALKMESTATEGGEDVVTLI